MELITKTIASIAPVKQSFLDSAQKRLDSLTKPQGSLGLLEDIAKKIVAITENEQPRLENKVIVTMAGDHGVVVEGVSAFPQEVTPQMVYNFVSGGAAINVLARHVGADVKVVDMGVNTDFDTSLAIINKKVAYGTKNFTEGPAMSKDEAVQSIERGIEVVYELKQNGLDIVGTGDMGIGNTTPSSAIAAVFLNCPVEQVTGRGTGIDDDALKNKIRVIEKGISVNSPDRDDPLDVLAKVGGFEIGGIAGVVLGAASLKIPVMVDGLISAAGAYIAFKLCPMVKDYIFAAHKSVEIGQSKIIKDMGLEPILDFDMRLGEGTGAALSMGIVDAATKILNDMATFGDAGVSGRDH
ncbi:MAG: nicotinate-nucleotide--dimethylbenzimidazole phosphoribosyltransferase [Candidatus Ancaeobacter aquaticus]|nr:nicotinate-nucleotide--dimethylbenzimidazole phosphoribosyltransferase [Candidatus Ancaeobacter aquaticus]